MLTGASPQAKKPSTRAADWAARSVRV